MKKLIAIIILFGSLSINSQEEAKDLKKSSWKTEGNISFLFNQSAFNNWIAGGANNISGALSLNYDFNYSKGDWTWDNKLIAAYGVTKIKKENSQKTDDRFEFTSLVGKKSSDFWYYSAFLNFKTQMSSTFVEGIQTSHFFSPAYFQFGPGLLWKKSDRLKINIAPATSKLILVDNNLTELAPAFGVEQGESSRYEIGTAINAYYKFNLMENVSVENILNLYSDYLEDFQNVDIDYTINIIMKVNKYLSANVAMQAIYDDNAFRGLQTKEVLSLGLNYNF